MPAIGVEEQISEINQKLDRITRELEREPRRREEPAGPKSNLLDIGQEFYRNAVGEFADFSERFHPGELVFLLRTLVSNAENITRAVEQLESMRDLLADLEPISREVFKDIVVRMEALEKRGYFQFAAGAGGILDAFVVAHSKQDLDQAQASVPHLVGFLRELTRPEVLQALEAIVYGFGEAQASEKKDVSPLQLLRQLNAPEARRGLAIIVKFLSVVGSESTKPGAQARANEPRKE